MRLAMLAAACLLLPAPAFAQDATADKDVSRIADQLRDPDRQQQVSAMAGAVIGALMDVKVAPIARAAAEMAGEDTDQVDPDLSVSDMMGEDAEFAGEDVAERMPQMMDKLAVLTGALAEMMPRLRELGRDMEDINIASAY